MSAPDPHRSLARTCHHLHPILRAAQFPRHVTCELDGAYLEDLWVRMAIESIRNESTD